MQRIIGESSTLAETLDHASRVATVNRPVLIVGERGSGKELVAERVHFLSPRWGEAFLKVNCAALSEELLDSELFGHEAGAFTGANKSRKGRFERAHGGTLFLDELGTLPLRIQEKLLRLIEYGEFERLGGQETLEVDVRIIAATNDRLPEMAKVGKFRHDLLDRLAFDVIQVPPLRDRQEDIPTLIDHFATRMCSEIGREYYSGFSRDVLNRLCSYSWPGNVRELKNVVERSVCHWQDSDTPIDEAVINPFPTDYETTTEDIATQENGIARASTKGKPVDFQKEVKNFELTLLSQALIECQHHQKHTAEYLGITYHQLRALLRKYSDELP